MSVLLGTKLRKNLLAYSFTHPEESFYVRELSGLIQEDPGNLSRELRKLEGEGIYSSKPRGNCNSIPSIGPILYFERLRRSF